MIDNAVFLELESEVRSYCRAFPAVFVRAKGSMIYDEEGREYIDFLAGAGALNFGHNHPHIQLRVIDYLRSDGLVHGLDFHTTAKRDFLHAFNETLLRPRGLHYKFQFCNPSGASAVEAALALARKIKRRAGVFAFMGGFHGVTMGSASVTGNRVHREAVGLPLSGVTFMPYPHGFMGSFDSIDYLETVLADVNSGIEKPAAMIFETVQSEGGVIVAPTEWLQRLRALCDRHDILLICDDIQAGCGRTGSYFSFERAGIVPDMVLMSKSVSGLGLPIAFVLLKPECDQWAPAEHIGTFRGHQLAFVGGTAALELWSQLGLEHEVKRKETWVRHYLNTQVLPLDSRLQGRGLGLLWGVDCSALLDETLTKRVARWCFEHGLIIERAGRNDQVLKLLPPLTIDDQTLAAGCEILRQGLVACL